VTAGSLPERAEAIRDRYREVFGTVPAGVEDRIAVAGVTGRLEAVEAIEELRRVLLAGNPLEARVQQLVHFAQLIALGRAGPARLHARGAVRAGAGLSDLAGVAETSLVTSGMPAYALAIEIIAELAGTLPPAEAPAAGAAAGQER
jgi:4-carboxymuconolactone decarboxylase